MNKPMRLKLLFLLVGFGALALVVSSCRDADEIRRALEQHSIPGATYVGMETCETCHEETVKRYRLESHYGTSLQEGEKIVGEACESCHGPGSLHAENDGDKTKIIRYSPERCYACHVDKQAQFQLQFHHPVNEGQVTCMDCHQLHQSGPAVRPVTDVNRPDEKCFVCHKEFKGPFIFEHDAMREGCQICHEPHGGVYPKMLIADGDTLCLRCHWQPSTNTPSAIMGGIAHGNPGGNYYIGAGESCVDHHRSPHGSNTWRTFNR
ncbi:MAG: hypothetical protein HY586_08040 [Candidatus Omnitrophica bacterium]|nr:hypothetical protein [Candidatus Omnitrophota bacterium]